MVFELRKLKDGWFGARHSEKQHTKMEESLEGIFVHSAALEGSTAIVLGRRCLFLHFH
jgi:hypothetical protein